MIKTSAQCHSVFHAQIKWPPYSVIKHVYTYYSYCQWLLYQFHAYLSFLWLKLPHLLVSELLMHLVYMVHWPRMLYHSAGNMGPRTMRWVKSLWRDYHAWACKGTSFWPIWPSSKVIEKVKSHNYIVKSHYVYLLCTNIQSFLFTLYT